MKLAIGGKGGVGKTTIAATLAKAFAIKGYQVLAIDADPNATLASAFGLSDARDIVPIVKMEGLIEEAKDLLEEDSDPRVLDAALICAAQRVEHYEIAGYGCVRSLAQQLGMTELAEELQETLDEEKKANEKLNELALGEINEEAMMSAGNTSRSSK